MDTHHHLFKQSPTIEQGALLTAVNIKNSAANIPVLASLSTHESVSGLGIVRCAQKHMSFRLDTHSFKLSPTTWQLPDSAWEPGTMVPASHVIDICLRSKQGCFLHLAP